MAIEIEKKYRLTAAQREQVLANLKDENAIFTGEDFETNEIYGSDKLEEKKAILRIRKIGDKAILTFKRRLPGSSAFKQQIEHETEISDADSVEAIFENLGYEKVVVYEKKRQTWKLKNVEVVLDELPFGLFMEIEGRMTDIALVEILLEAEEFEAVNESYPRLTYLLGKKNGNTIEARFEKKS